MHTSSDLISVILPVYNAQDYIAASIQSILDQTYSNFELLVLHDGSTDSSLTKIQSIHDDRIRLINDGENKGLVYRLNQGIRIARGKYIARMDADDIALPYRLEKQLHFLENNPEIGIVGTWFELFGDTKPGVIKTPLTHNQIVFFMLKGNPLAHPSIMVRTDLMKKYGGYRKTDFPLEDYLLWVRMARHIKFANLSEVLLKYRVHPVSVSEQNKNIQQQRLNEARKLAWETIMNRPIDDDEFTLLNALYAGAYYPTLPVKKLRELLHEFNHLEIHSIDSAFLRTALQKKFDRMLRHIKQYNRSLLPLCTIPQFREFSLKKQLVFITKCLVNKQYA